MGWASIAVISVIPFSMGLSRLPSWALLVLPAILVALGIKLTAAEPPNYDMPGFGLFLYGGAALIWLAVSLAGRGVRIAHERTGERRHRSDVRQAKQRAALAAIEGDRPPPPDR